MLVSILVAMVAVEHVYIMILEMCLWTRPRTLKLFGFELSLAEQTKAMAANQGLYNGFLAAGLFWSLVHSDLAIAFQLQIFFLLCVLVAAVFGAATIKKQILFMQGVPAFLALIAVFVF